MEYRKWGSMDETWNSTSWLSNTKSWKHVPTSNFRQTEQGVFTGLEIDTHHHPQQQWKVLKEAMHLKKEQEGIYIGVWREEWEGRNDVIKISEK